MKLWRGLGRRIVIASVLAGLLGLFVALGLLRQNTRSVLRAGLAPTLLRVLEAGELQRCEGAPERWSYALHRGGVRAYAYDGETARSANSAAPPLDADLVAALTSGEATPLRVHPLGAEYGGAMLLRAAPSGPCALIVLTLPPHPLRARRHALLLLSVALVVSALGAAISLLVVLRPLARRIGRVRTAAGLVGTPSGYLSAADGTLDELGELSRMLDVAHARIRKDADALADRAVALEKHLADVAHDLKTPLTSLQLALGQAYDCSPIAVREVLATAVRDAVYLDGLTNNLRLVARLRDGWDPAQSTVAVDLADLVDRVVGRAQRFAHLRAVAVEGARPDAPVFARCDRTAAEQLLTNLVDNAIRYAQPGGHAAIVLERLPENRFRLLVLDDGPGVSPEELPRLAERRYRSLDAREREPTGQGIGLAIANEICARCSFSLVFSAQEPHGLCVSIEGPCAPSVDG